MSRKNWKQAEATVFTCGVQTHYDNQSLPTQDYLITFSYEIDGEWYSGEFNSSKPWEESSKFLITYDPDDPKRTSMDDPVEDRWIKILIYPIGIVLALLGYWLKHKYWD